MLLAPQHFQQLASRCELLTQYLCTQSGAFCWGVIELKIDDAALSGGVLRVLNVEAVMPDGLLALGGSERGVKLEFELQKAFESQTADGERARICLTVPREAALYVRSDYSRYEAIKGKDRATPDDVSGADPANIPRIRARMRLTSGEANLTEMTAVPLVEFKKQGTVFVRTGYIEPLLRIKKGSALADLCAPVSKIRKKSAELARKLTPEEKSSCSPKLLQIQWLVSSLPLVEALLESEQTHPHSLYLALCSMAGSVAVFSNALIPPKFPDYDHSDLLASFQPVLGFIDTALSEGFVENWIGKEFSLVRKQSFERDATDVSRLEAHFEIPQPMDEGFGAEADFSSPYLALTLQWAGDVPPEHMIEWGQSCLLGKEEDIFGLELSRSQGAICEPCESIDGLLPGPRTVLFRIKNDGKWLDRNKKLVLKPAKQEKRMPATATLFIKKRSQMIEGV